MANSDNLQELQKQLSTVKAGIRDSLARQAELEKKNLWLTWGIVIVILGFMLAGYVTLKNNFSSEKVQESLVAHGPEMAASIGEAVAEAATEVIPVYYDEVANQSVAMLPEASVMLEKELAAMGEETSKKVEEQLSAALERVEAQQKKNLHETFPDLKDEDIEKLLDKVMVETESELEGLTGYILSKTVGDIITLDKTIKSFDTSNLPSEEHELSRLLVHNFLLVLDDELMEMPLEKPAADKAKKGAK